MTYLITEQLADSRQSDRLDVARRQRLLARLLCLLRTPHPTQRAELPTLLTGHKVERTPRWWTALQKGQTVETAAARRDSVAVHEPCEC
jgi:hypothetical protein